MFFSPTCAPWLGEWCCILLTAEWLSKIRRKTIKSHAMGIRFKENCTDANILGILDHLYFLTLPEVSDEQHKVKKYSQEGQKSFPISPID